MTFYITHIPNGKKFQISKETAYKIIRDMYGNKFVDRSMEDLLKNKYLGVGWFNNLIYEPTPENYCNEQGCSSDPERCGYYPSICIKEKYGVE